MGFAVSNNSIGLYSGGYTSGGSRQQIENDLTKLKKQRDDFEQQTHLEIGRAHV